MLVRMAPKTSKYRGSPQALIRWDRILLWLVALTAPCAIIYLEAPISATPIRVVVAASSIVVVSWWLTTGKARLTYGELSFFILALAFSSIAAVRSSVQFDQAAFFWQSVALFSLTYIVTTHYSRGEAWEADQLIDLSIATAVVFAVLGIVDWVYALAYGQGLWKILFSYRGDSSFVVEYGTESLVIPRAMGLFADPNLFAYYLLLPTLLAIVSIAEKGKRPWRLLALRLGTLAVLGAAIILSMSRSGIGVMVGAISVLVVAEKRVRKQVAWFLLGGICVVVMVEASGLGIGLGEVAETRLAFSEDAAGIVGLNRVERILAGMRAFTERPVVGVGIGDLGRFMPSDVRHPEVVTSHSFYLDILASMGLLGFSVLVFGTVLFLWRVWVGAKKSAACRAALIAVLGVLATQLVYRNLLSPAIAFQLAVVSTICRRNGGKERTKPTRAAELCLRE